MFEFDFHPPPYNLQILCLRDGINLNEESFIIQFILWDIAEKRQIKKLIMED